MTKEKWLLIVLAVVLVSAGIYHWISTTPTWTAYHKYYGDITSLETFDALMLDVEVDVTENFNKYSIRTEQARQDIISYLDKYSQPIVDEDGNYGYIKYFQVDAWAWVWDGAGMAPSWEVVGKWRDTWRTFCKSSKELIIFWYYVNRLC